MFYFFCYLIIQLSDALPNLLITSLSPFSRPILHACHDYESWIFFNCIQVLRPYLHYALETHFDLEWSALECDLE